MEQCVAFDLGEGQKEKLEGKINPRMWWPSMKQEDEIKNGAF